MNTKTQDQSTLLPLETELYLAIQQKASLLQEQVMKLLRPYQLSTSQYNIMRILRGAGKNGCTCGEIAWRMMTKDPDITRLLDRLEQREYIARTRSESDRRVVKSFITKQGLELLKQLDEPIKRLHEQQFNGFNAQQKQQLKKWLDRMV